MPVSDKFKDVKFTKSIAGYSAAEVDGFINDVLPLLQEQEQLLAALRVKLEAFEAQRDSIADKEQEAYRLLEAAKSEAEIIVATAKKNAETVEHDANVAAEVQLRAAKTRATELIASAESRAEQTESEAHENAEKIIRTADAEARATIEKVRAYSEEEKRKVQELSNECYNFETRFRMLVADTAKAFAEIKEQVPLSPTVSAEPVIKQEEEKPCEPAETEVAEERKAPAEPEKELAEPETVTDIEIAGGKPVMRRKSEGQKRHLYDTVNVVYDDDSDDDFKDIRDIMNRTGKRKSPTDFSE